MENIFQVGDRVFDIMYGWGVVEQIDKYNRGCVSVLFDDNLQRSYLGGGLYSSEGGYPRPVLSFTEYRLEGFTQERLEELPKKGDIVWASNHKSNWYITYFLEKDSIGGYKTTSHNPFDKTPSYSHWNYITTENPYKNENASI
jgi:hypothetical protein